MSNHFRARFKQEKLIATNRKFFGGKDAPKEQTKLAFSSKSKDKLAKDHVPVDEEAEATNGQKVEDAEMTDVSSKVNGKTPNSCKIYFGLVFCFRQSKSKWYHTL